MWKYLFKLFHLLNRFFLDFQGRIVRSTVTGRYEPYYPSWKRNLFRYFVSIPVMLMCLSIVFVVLWCILELQNWVNVKVQTGVAPFFCKFFPKILLAICITLMDEAYKRIAFWLNNKGEKIESKLIKNIKNEWMSDKWLEWGRLYMLILAVLKQTEGWWWYGLFQVQTMCFSGNERNYDHEKDIYEAEVLYIFQTTWFNIYLIINYLCVLFRKSSPRHNVRKQSDHKARSGEYWSTGWLAVSSFTSNIFVWLSSELKAWNLAYRISLECYQKLR